MDHFVMIGAGQAAAALAAKLRSEGFGGAITLIGAESAPPYQRPPLSKAYLLGEMELERLHLRGPAFWEEQNVTLRLGTRATGIDSRARTIELEAGETISYDKLALTTGAWPRQLPAAIGGTLAGVFSMRDLNDADTLAPELTEGRRMLIVGGGYIGLEAAAVAAKKGLDVTLIEAAPRILGRVAAPETADYFRALHTAHGVTIREGVGLERLEGGERLERAVLAGGEVIEIDLALVGIGIQPATILAESAGLALDNGIATDTQCRTSDAAIWAAGDCASFLHGGLRMRLESVGNAIDMGEAAALNMLGQATPYQPKPWFWSDQYDCHLQIAGLNTGYDKVVVRGEGETRSHWYFGEGTLLAVDAMNDSRAYMIGKRLIEAGKTPPVAVIADASANLKPLLKA